MKELSLPEFAFMDDDCHGATKLNERTVIIHIPTLTIMEVVEAKDVILNSNITYKTFEVTGEDLLICVHRSAYFNDKIKLLEVLDDAIKWYTDYCHWEDGNIKNNELSTLN